VYLSQLDVEGFRSLSPASVTLDRDVSVLVGENSGGKVEETRHALRGAAHEVGDNCRGR
jgi:hypothetical protein